MTNLAIVSGGLREPSSTRLLADRIGERFGQGCPEPQSQPACR